MHSRLLRYFISTFLFTFTFQVTREPLGSKTGVRDIRFLSRALTCMMYYSSTRDAHHFTVVYKHNGRTLAGDRAERNASYVLSVNVVHWLSLRFQLCINANDFVKDMENDERAVVRLHRKLRR
jgi:hypothetical protein